jgi:outer membrane autotransporter protein
VTGFTQTDDAAADRGSDIGDLPGETKKMANRTIARAGNARRLGKMGRSRMARAVALGILLGGMFTVPVQAAQSVWTGAISDDWADGGNWVTPPTSGSFVLIDALAPRATHLRTLADVGTLTVGYQAQGALTIEAGGDLTVTGGDGYSVGLLLGDQAGSEGTVTVTGAGSRLAVDQTVQVGKDGDGTLNIVDGATAELAMHGMYSEVGVGAGYYYGAQGTGAGHILVDGAGSTLTHAGGMNVLEGSLVVSNGGQVVSVARAEDYDVAPAWVDEVGGSATDNSAVAVATVTGAGSAWNSRNALQVAYGGTGTLNVLDGATAGFAGFVYVGNRSRVFDADNHPTGEYVYGNGTLLVSGEGSTFTLGASEIGDGNLGVGYYGTGKMTVADGGSAAVADVVVVGGQAGATGALDITGGGTMSIAGSDANLMGLTIGDVATSTGTVTVSGAGSSLTVDAGAQIGNAGTGSLSVLAGGEASIGLGRAYSEIVMGLGYYGWGTASEQGSGTLLVDGAGSTLTYAGGLNLLAGSVTVSNGGTLEALHRDADGETTWLDLIGFGVPADPDPAHAFDGLRGVGSVTITGEGSSWNSVNALDIGDGGDGTLSVLAGADVAFGDLIRAGGRAYLYDSLGGSPVPGVDPQAGTGAIVVSGAGSTLTAGNRAIVGDRANATGTLTVAAGGAATVDGSDTNGIGLIVGNAARSTGTVTVTGAGSTLTAAAGAQIGNSGTGTLSVLDGGHAVIGLGHAYSEIVMGLGYYGWGTDNAQGRGVIEVDGAGSTLEYAGGLNLLNGSVSVTGGGQIKSVSRASEGGWNDLIGFGVPADPDPSHDFAGLRGAATVTVSGEGSAWNSVNGLEVGDGGDGTLLVLAGADASFQGDALLGGRSYLYDANGGSPVPDLAPQTGTGSVTVSGAGSTLAISAGLSGTKGKLTIGRYGVGNMLVGNGATATVADVLSVGDLAAGTLRVSDGGTMSVDADAAFGGTLGVNKGTTGTVIVSGAGSKLSFGGGLQVGNAGTGVLSVLGGGTVEAGLGVAFTETLLGFGNYGFASDAESGNGTLTVSGTGSTFRYAGGLNVLNGTATVSGGGKVVSQKRVADGTGFWSDTIGFGVPKNPDGSYAGFQRTGTVTVTGAGSAWTSVNGLNIGYGSNGSLSVLDGASASFNGYVELGKLSYLYDSPTGGPIPGIAGIAGSGTLLVSGAGSSFSLAAISGNTTWGTGVLELGSEGAGSVTVNNGGTLSAAGGIKVGALGTVTIGGTQGGALAAPGTIASGINLSAPTATLVFDHNATAYDFARIIGGNGLVDVAAGFTRLTGDSSAFAGSTTVESGATLSVNGSLGGAIGVDGRLQGTGTVGQVTVHDGGTLAPGNSPGTLHVNGDLVMESGSLYDAEIDGDSGASDSVAVAGNVTIESGTTLSVTNIGGTPLTPGTNLQLIDTSGTGTIEGAFETVTGSSDFLDLGLSYEGGKIVVDVMRSESVTFASVADARYAGVGAALDGAPDASALTALVFTQVTSAAEAQAVLPEMAGTMHADLRRVMLEGSRYPRNAIVDRLQDDDASGGVAWARAMGGSASTDGSGGLPGAAVDHHGVMVGYDAAVGDSRLGIAIGTDKASYEVDGRDASANLYSRHVSLYGRSLLGGLRLGYGVAFGANDAKATRGFNVGTEPQRLYAKHEARTTQGFVDLGYRLDGGRSFRYLEPFLNLARVQVDDDATTEEGSVTALEIAAGDTSATLGTIGLRWSADMGGADFAGSIGWRHAFGFDGASATQAFVAGGPSFTIDSLPIDNAVVVDLGARFRMADHARVWLGYNGMVSGSAHDHGLKLQFNLDL